MNNSRFIKHEQNNYELFNEVICYLKMINMLDNNFLNFILCKASEDYPKYNKLTFLR